MSTVATPAPPSAQPPKAAKEPKAPKPAAEPKAAARKDPAAGPTSPPKIAKASTSDGAAITDLSERLALVEHFIAEFAPFMGRPLDQKLRDYKAKLHARDNGSKIPPTPPS